MRAKLNGVQLGLDKLRRKIFSELLFYQSHKIYKLCEAITESLPQIILQLYVVLQQRIDFRANPLLIISLVISITSNSYAGCKMFFPNGIVQNIVVFLYAFFDMVYRSFGFCFFFLVTYVSGSRLYILSGYALFIGTFTGVYTNMNSEGMVSERLPGKVILCSTVLLWSLSMTFSSTAGFFIGTQGYNSRPKSIMLFILIESGPRVIVTGFFIFGGHVDGWDRYFEPMVYIIVASAIGSWIMFGYMWYRFDHIQSLPTAEVVKDT